MFMEYRRELKVLFDNITQLVSHLPYMYKISRDINFTNFEETVLS